MDQTQFVIEKRQNEFEIELCLNDSHMAAQMF